MLPEVRVGEDGSRAYECIFQGRRIVEIGLEDRDSLGDPGNGAGLCCVAGDASDCPAREGDEGVGY